jgi:feruloyl esterase
MSRTYLPLAWKRGLTVAALGALAGCSTPPPGSVPPGGLGAAVGAPLAHCAGLGERFTFAETVIDSAVPQAAGALKLAGADIAAHCLVRGAMQRRKGADGQDYAIGFEMRLPVQWNGRFYYQANGGIDGVVQPAQGALGGGPVTGALMQGFAVISSDAGHSARQNPRFGEEPQARADYGYGAVAKLTPMAKALIAAAYGKGPDRSYIGGCSNGGRHVMVAASRMPEAYDGYLAGAPGYRLPNAALAQVWALPQWLALSTPGATVSHPFVPTVALPNLGTAFTVAERQAVADAVLARCDALDGATDGMVLNTDLCQARFNLMTDLPTCAGADAATQAANRNGRCLTAAQKQTLAAVQAGGRVNGQPIYSAFPWDPGIASANWAQWKFVNSQALDPGALAYIFTAPPRGPALSGAPFTANVADVLAGLSGTSPTFRESPLEQMSPPDQSNPMSLQRLQERRAKMLIYHGVSDAIFSAEDTRQWMLRAERVLGAATAQTVRYFPVPGMNHCSAGPATDQVDFLTPLVRWVEQGEAPASITARARGPGNPGGVNTELPAVWSPNRTRPLCPWPQVAVHNQIGAVSGGFEEATGFSCRAP